MIQNSSYKTIVDTSVTILTKNVILLSGNRYYNMPIEYLTISYDIFDTKFVSSLFMSY